MWLENDAKQAEDDGYVNIAVCSLVKQRFQVETPENLRRKAERWQWRLGKKATAFLVSQLKSYCAPMRTESQFCFLSCFIHCKFSQHWCLTKNSCQFVSRGLTKFFLTRLNRFVFFIIEVNVSRSQGYRLPRRASGTKGAWPITRNVQ